MGRIYHRGGKSNSAPTGRNSTAAPRGLSIDTREEDEGIRLILRGSLDLASVLAFRETAFTVLGARPPRFYIDLSALPLPDISGLNALVTIARVARLVDVRLCLVVSCPLKRLMEQTGLIRMVTLETPPLREQNLEG